MRNLTSLDRDFELKMDQLVTASFAHPIYNSNHANYYRSTQNLDCLSDHSIVIVDHNGTPVVGVKALSFRNPVSKKTILSYFGNPAALFISRDQHIDLINEGLISLARHFKSLNFTKILVESEYFFRAYGYLNNHFDSEFLELILKSSKKIDVEFERIINLDLTEDKLRERFSKSVVVATKQFDKTKIETQIASWADNKIYISESIGNIRSLHLASAGRLTRSAESWAIQEKQVLDGTMISVNGFMQNENVHGSLFLLSNTSAYYGVSANLLRPGLSVSHLFLVEAMFFLKKIGINHLYLGRQYENLSGVCDKKILSISKFKSFFGGFVTSNLVVNNET